MSATGTGGVGMGMMPEDDMDMMDGMDMGDEPMGDEPMGDEPMDDMGPGLDMEEEGAEAEMVEVDKAELRSFFDQVADGSMSPDEAVDACCGGALDDDMGGMDDLAGDSEMGDPEMGDQEMDVDMEVDDMDVDMEAECWGEGEDSLPMESKIAHIAGLLTEDPDFVLPDKRRRRRRSRR